MITLKFYRSLLKVVFIFEIKKAVMANDSFFIKISSYLDSLLYFS